MSGPKGPTAPRPRRQGLRGSPEELAAVARVVAELNQLARRAYRAESQASAPILARLREGYPEADLLAVVRNRVERWRDDPKMAEYLQPSTLFRPQKFPEYLADAQAEQAEAEQRAEQSRKVDEDWKAFVEADRKLGLVP